ncbi:MAG: hypothetical protein M4D80_38755 [Myxococcota bacterium]|nr:hypothetical protein [Myxococcota bacterium]
MSEADNHRRWAADAQGVYEVWYTTWNDPKTDQGFWLRYITENPVDGPPRGELWFARFDPRDPSKTFGIHKRFSDVHEMREPWTLVVGGSLLGHDHANGKVDGDGHSISWELHWDPAPEALRWFPDVFYSRPIAETTVHSPNPRVRLSGTLVVDGEEITFDRAIAGQTHLWGKKHAYSWTWGRCADFTGAPDAALELLGARLQRRGIMLPPIMLVMLDLEGTRYRFNQFRHLVMNRGTWRTGRTTFEAWSPLVKIEGELTCAPDDMVNAPYLDPDGTEVFCCNTEIGDARVTVYKRSGLGWKEFRRLEGRRRAHFEIGGRTRDPEVTRPHVLVP